jgi:hypothetical protein
VLQESHPGSMRGGLLSQGPRVPGSQGPRVGAASRVLPYWALRHFCHPGLAGVSPVSDIDDCNALTLPVEERARAGRVVDTDRAITL